MKDDKTLSVSQLNGYIKSVFDDELILHNIGVTGELSQISVREKATYFTITEGDCYINCIIFSAVEKIEAGTEVRAYGRVAFFAKSGKINFYAKSISPVGKGTLHAELLKRKDKLKSEGLFENRLQPPVYIRSVAVITSSAGAVIHDIMSVIRDKGVSVSLKLFSSAVQGDNADKEIVNALQAANASDADVIVLARGGGSQYDLDVFNNETVARAVANSKIPVISAVGHETDYTLCDFCAGRRAGTPSIAADMIAEINLSFRARLKAAYKRINTWVARKCSNLAARLVHSASKVVYIMDNKAEFAIFKIQNAARALSTTLDERFQFRLQNMKSSVDRAHEAMATLENRHETRLREAVKSLEYGNPLKILAKGYVRVQKDNRDVGSADELSADDFVNILLKDGIANAQIKTIKKMCR